MRLTVRLYPLYDMDLIPYKLDKSFRFGLLVKNALRAYSNGEKYTLPLAPKVDWSSYDYCPLDCSIDFKDAPELEQLFDGMRKRYKSAFVKMILRQCCNYVDMSGFFNDVVVKKDYTHKNESAEKRREKNEFHQIRESYYHSDMENSVNAEKSEKKTSVAPAKKANFFESEHSDNSDGYKPIELEDDDDLFDSFSDMLRRK